MVLCYQRGFYHNIVKIMSTSEKFSFCYTFYCAYPRDVFPVNMLNPVLYELPHTKLVLLNISAQKCLCTMVIFLFLKDLHDVVLLDIPNLLGPIGF